MTAEEFINNNELYNKVVAKIKERGPITLCWDYDDELADEEIQELFEKGSDALTTIESDINEYNEDYIYDESKELVEEALKDCGVRLDSYEDFIEVFDELRDYVEVDLNARELVSNHTVNAKVVVDGCYIQGAYELSQSIITYDDVKEVCDVLNMNPQRFAKELSKYFDVDINSFPYLKKRSYVDYKDMAEEFTSTTSNINYLTFLVRVNLVDLLNIGGKPKEIIIPKGNVVGLFSYDYGAGSAFDTVLTRDLKLKLDDRIKLDPDCCSMLGYSAKEVYGFVDEVFGSIAKIY